MKTKFIMGAVLGAMFTLTACEENKSSLPPAAQTQPQNPAVEPKGAAVNNPQTISKDEWRKKLDPQQYAVTCEGSTERAFTGKYWDHHETGIYKCVRCGVDLFASDTKFDSGSGWPSYTAPINKDGVTEHADDSLGMKRTEVVCSHCGAHLGHVFPDGPKPTGNRFCINSAALNFEKKK